MAHSKNDNEEYTDLLLTLQKEERNSIGYESDQIYNDQIKAFERYTGENYGDEQPGRSQVHDRTVFETIEWMRPDLERVFASGGNSVIVEPWEEGTDDAAQDASDYLNRLFFEEMDGGQIVDTFAFDGLLQKRGVGAVYWSEAELGEPETIQGGPMELQQLQQQDVEVLEVKVIDEAQQMASVTFQRVIKAARPMPVNIAPEDFRMASRSISLTRPRYCGHIERITKSDLKLEFPDKVDLIEEYASSSLESTEIDERRSARFFDEDQMYSAAPEGDELTSELILWREYIHHDLNEDGFAELLEVFRLDGCILSVEPVEDNPYFSWTPIPIPHRWFGLSIYDIAKDIQKTKTTLLRAALDSTYLSVAPRMMANKNVNLSDLLTVRPGAIIRSNSTNPVGQDVMPVVTPDLTGSAIGMMEVVDQMGERRTGQNRNAQGMDPDTLNKTATGIKLMQNAASIRKEQIARNLGRGLEMMFRKMYRLVIAKQEGGQKLHVGKGQFKEFTPQQWAPEAKVRIHVGNGSGDRETQLNQLMMLQAGQKEFVANFGMANPIVGIKQLYALQEDIGRVIGMRGITQYFADPDSIDPEQLQQMMAPKPDPKAEEAKAKMEMEGQKLQMQMQGDQAKMQQAAQMDQAKLQQQAMADEQKQQIEAQRMEREFELKRYQIDQEMQLKANQLAMELDMKERQFEAELAMKERLGIQANKAKMNGGGTSGVHVGGDPG